MDTVSCVRLKNEFSDWFYVSCGDRQGCTVAPSLSLLPVDWVLQRTSHGGFLAAALGTECQRPSPISTMQTTIVTCLAEMLEVLLLALHVLTDEAHPLGLEVN